MKYGWKQILLALSTGTIAGTIVMLLIIYIFSLVHIIASPVNWLFYFIVSPLISLFLVCFTLYFGDKLYFGKKFNKTKKD